MSAIVLRNVKKHFKKQTVRREYTTFKTELLRLLQGKRKLLGASLHIEALRGIDLVVPRGKTVGVIGRNGSGKSTLLKLVTGIYAPTSGTVEVNGRISALLELGAGFHPDFTGRENITINGIILGMSRSQIKARIDEIIRFAELGDFIDEPVRTYSSGMYMRLAFAVATHVDPDILIIDEILSVGDEHFSKKSMAKMNEFKTSGKTILLVTHDLNTVQNWCDLVAWVDGGRIRMFGAPAEVIAQYRQAVALAEQQTLETGSSALSAPGLALPELHGSSKETLQQVRITQLEWTDAEGRALETIPSQQETNIQCRFEIQTPGSDWALRLRLTTPDGVLVFQTDSSHGPGSRPSMGNHKGHALVQLPRLALASGEYLLFAEAVGPSKELLSESARLPVVFKNEFQGEGLLRLPPTWKFITQPLASSGVA